MLFRNLIGCSAPDILALFTSGQKQNGFPFLPVTVEQIFVTTRQKKRSGCCNIDENRIEQCFAAHIVHSCQQY